MTNTRFATMPCSEPATKINYPVLLDETQFDYLFAEAKRNAALYGEAVCMLSVTVARSRHNTVAVLRARLRETDMIAHADDGSFVVLLPDTSFLEATVVAEKLRGGDEMSVGVASSEVGLHDMLQRSQEAMHRAIGLGGNRVCF